VKKDSARFRVLLGAFMRNDLSERCRKFLEKMGISVADITQKAEQTEFWDVRSYSSRLVSELPGVSGTFAAPTLGELLAPWAAATVVRNSQRQIFPHVVFGGAFTTGLDVFHEMLHLVTELGDVDLANGWDLGTFDDDVRGTAQASQAITLFFDPRGWDCGARIGWPAP
jgi:hypothetical protein